MPGKNRIPHAEDRNTPIARQSTGLAGQSLVEFALIAPLLVTILVIAIDLGRVFAVWISTTNSAREAAYFGSRSVVGSVSDASIRSIAAGEGSGAQISADATHVVITYPAPDLIEVSVRSQFQPIAPMVRSVWGGNDPWLTGSAAFPIRAPTSTALPVTPSTPVPTPTPVPPAIDTPTPVTRTATPTGTPVVISLIQSTVASASSGTTVSATLGQPPLPGQMLIAIVGSPNGSTLRIAGWSIAIDGSGGNASQAIFYKVAGASEPSTVTATRSNGGQTTLQVFEYRGLAPTSPVDATATGINGAGLKRDGGTFTCGSVTITRPNELLITGFANQTTTGTNVSTPWTGSFTELRDFRDTSNKVLGASAHRIVASAGTYSTGSKLQGGGGSGAARCQTAAFKAVF